MYISPYIFFHLKKPPSVKVVMVKSFTVNAEIYVKLKYN